MSDERVARLIEQATRLRWNRRQILKRAAALGLAAPAISMVLAACGDDDDDEPTQAASTATTGAGAATATTGSAGSPTTAGSSPTAAGGGETPTEDGAEPTATTAASGETPTTATEGGRGGIIVFNNTTGDTGVGNPILSTATTHFAYFAFNRLMIYDDEGTLQPELATDWAFTDDNLELTINLHDGVTWHDGEPFSADDVIFTFDTIKAETTDTNLRSRLQVGGDFVTWEAVDPLTIKMTMTAAFAPLLFNLNDIEIVPKHILEAVEDINTADFNKNPIGTGPFKLVEWEQDQFVRYERNPDYFLGDVKPDGVTVLVQENTDVGAASLEAGEIDLMFTPPEIQPNYENNPDFTLHNYVYFTPITLAFNHKHPILSDVNVRRAIAMAIDKESLTETVTKGRGLVAHNQFADTGPLDRYNDYDNRPAIEFDVEAANKLLDDSGYMMGDDGIRQTADGQKFSFNIITYSGFEEYLNDQVILQEMLREIGVELTPQVVEYTTLEGMWSDPNDDPANRALELEEWPHPFEFDPDLYNELHSSNFPPGFNYMWFKDDQVDQLIEQGRTTTDPDARVEIYRQLDVRRGELLDSVPLYIAVDGWVRSNRIQGVKDTPYFRRYYLYGVKDWWKEE
jgi:peptide/nickel transport system substrate-binding protein